MRYVDDVFVIFNSTDVQLFLNNQHPNFCFIYEGSSGPSLPFLDVEVTICDREFDVCVCRKPTFTLTFVLLHFNTIAPLSWKRGLILMHRAHLYS